MNPLRVYYPLLLQSFPCASRPVYSRGKNPLGLEGEGVYDLPTVGSHLRGLKWDDRKDGGRFGFS